MKRVFLYNFTPSAGEIPDYVSYCLRTMRPHFDQTLVTVNGALDEANAKTLAGCCDSAVLNGDWQSVEEGYKAGLEHLGWEYLQSVDELTLMDYDLFGPVFPFTEMRSSMDARESLDFWSIGEQSMKIEGEPQLALSSSFLTFRKRLLHSEDFQKFWASALSPKTTEPFDLQLTSRLNAQGYKSAGFISLSDYETDFPLLFEIKESLENARRPFVPFSPFCGSPALQDENPANLNLIIPYIERHSDYPIEHFWQGALKNGSLRTLHTNLAYQFTFSSEAYDADPKWDASLKVAVCAHIYYEEAFEEIYARACNIPTDFDLYITTSSQDKKEILDEKCAKAGVKADVRVVGKNQGRDMSSLFIDLKDVVIDKDYDLICRLHSKKSPQVNPSTGNYFKNLIFDSVLASREYTSHLFDFFMTHPQVGMAFAPLIHTGYGSMGHAWFSNRGIFGEILDDLGYKVPREPYSALAAYGTVFWFRPDALRPMFDGKYEYSDYNEEPNHIDGGLAHGQERAMTYVAQARGYMSATVWPDHMAAQSTTLMEYKMDSLYTHFEQKHVAPHRHLMTHVGGNMKVVKNRRIMHEFEVFCRPTVKKIGAFFGITSTKESRKKST